MAPEVIERKWNVFRELGESLVQANAPVRRLFRSLDTDDSAKIDFAEFRSALAKMNVDVDDKMAREIFRSVDLDGDGQISWAEFHLDFNKCRTLSLQTL